jgi:hypothetical protein
VIALLLAVSVVEPLALAQDPALKPTARVAGGSFVCEGTTDLPDEARLTVSVDVVRGESSEFVGSLNAEAKDGKFALELPIFAKEVFPGSYRITVTFDPMLQRKDLGLPFTQKQVPIEVPGDPRAAALRYYDELRKAVGEMDRLRKELPADWAAQFAQRVSPLLERAEGRITGVVTQCRTSFEGMHECIGALTTAPAEERPATTRTFETIRLEFMQFLDELSMDAKRAIELLDEIERALAQDKPVDALLLKLDGAAGAERHDAVTRLATLIAEGDKAKTAEAIAALRRALTAAAAPK